MDHYFGEAGVITEINSTFVEVKMDNQITGKKYGWALSTDMLAHEDGTYTPIPKTQEPVRKFMPKTKKPITRTVWKQLQALQKTEELPEGSLAPLLRLYLDKPFDEFIHYITHSTQFKASTHLAKAKVLQSYYPKMNIETLVFLWEAINVTKTDHAQKGIKMFLEVAANKAFKIEYDASIPFTPTKRMLQKTKPEDINLIWKNLSIYDSLDSKRTFSDITTLQSHIIKSVNNYMDKYNLIKLTDQKITIR